MKLWPVFVVCTILCWGAYVPILHSGQVALGKNSALRAFLFVGAAYFTISILALAWLYLSKSEPMTFTTRGMTLSTLAGVVGAIGALGIVFALKGGGSPIYVAPLVFAGAPIVNTFVSMIWHKQAGAPSPMFFAGIVLAAIGGSMVLYFRPT